MGIECERINLSGNTTLDQLIGSIVPSSVGGQRVFSWHDGKLVQALRSRQWILFDEINLAPPEVLEGLSFLLDRRNVSHFRVPLTDELIDLSESRVFATMNPISTGGGRVKLPRSIKTLFTTVTLDVYGNSELESILSFLAADLTGNHLTREHLDKVFLVHLEVKEKLARRELGRTGGPDDVNLRDLTKLLDIVRGNAKDQQYHNQFFFDEKHDLKSEDSDDYRLLGLRKFLELAYGGGFQGISDQETVRNIINDKMPLPPNLKERATCSVDLSSPAFIRVGSIYLERQDFENPFPPLVHTRCTIQQLEILAASCQSKRAVLLEGDTCSRKTALVCELARLTRHELVVIPMNHDVDTSDLLGKWLPTSEAADEQQLLLQGENFVSRLTKFLLLSFLPLVQDGADQPKLQEVLAHVQTGYHLLAQSSAASAREKNCASLQCR